MQEGQACRVQRSVEVRKRSAEDCCTAEVANRVRLLQSNQFLLPHQEVEGSSRGERWALVQLAQQDYRQPLACTLGSLPKGLQWRYEQLEEDQGKPLAAGQETPV